MSFGSHITLVYYVWSLCISFFQQNIMFVSYLKEREDLNLLQKKCSMPRGAG